MNEEPSRTVPNLRRPCPVQGVFEKEKEPKEIVDDLDGYSRRTTEKGRR